MSYNKFIMMIDAHAHLNDELYADVKKLIDDANEVAVNTIICSSYDLSSSMKAVEIANSFTGVYANVGMHPHDSKLYDDNMEKTFLELATNKKVIAIGEIGLDYHYDYSPRQTQKEVFERQILLAKKLNLPIVIHMREATEDTIEILRQNKNNINLGGLVHCFNGSYETFKMIYEMGFIISIGGALTFKNAKNLLELIPKIPKDGFIFETDCPYLTPEPFRGQINTPKNVKLVYDKASQILNLELNELCKIVEENVKRVFKI